MHSRTLLFASFFASVLSASCEEENTGRRWAAPEAMRANLKNAVLIGVVAQGAGSGQQAQRVGLAGVRKDGFPLCEELSVEDLEELDSGGDYANDCINPDPLSYCQDIHPEKLATGRVDCRQRPWRVGELIAVDHDGEAFSVLPTLPEWNEVTRLQQSEGALLVTLKHPMKLLATDQTEDYCHVLYYVIDTQSDAITPYCYEYEYTSTFCFGPEQPIDWTVQQKNNLMGVPTNGEECPYEEHLTDVGGGVREVCAFPSSCPSWYTPMLDYVHVTPYALFEAFYAPAEETATRIVSGDEEAFYPLDIDFYARRGIISAGTYYTFDSQYNSITGVLSADPIHSRYEYDKNTVFESGSLILYGLVPPEGGSYTNAVSTHDETAIRVDFFDTETMEDGSFFIDLSPHPMSADPDLIEEWHFIAAVGDYLFLQEDRSGTNLIFRVDLRNAQPTIELAHQNTDTSPPCEADWSVVMNGYAVNSPSEVPFVAYLMKPDGAVVEVNAAMLGFNPQKLEIQDDQIVVTGMDGLTPRRFIIHPLATEEGELLVETTAETIPVKILVPLQ